MSPLAFLGLAAAITLLGMLCLTISGRKKTPWESSIDSFRRHLDLSPEAAEAARNLEGEIGGVTNTIEETLISKRMESVTTDVSLTHPVERELVAELVNNLCHSIWTHLLD